ncbi:MAG: hypothetical protein B0W54_02705 [Cellvibrio sp. 79]|nr:MAG: hypothetical protein B0W54_02705 [Cellvibrio sp. 79]
MRNKFFLMVSLWLINMVSVGASATEIHPANGSWYLFDVDALVSQSGGVEWIDAQQDDALGYTGDGSALTFSFSLTNSAFLNLVDAGLAGDVFTLLINGNSYTSSAVAAESNAFAGIDFDAAWAAPEFSKLSVLLAPGSYTITGFLNQSAIDEYGVPYMATAGGLQIVNVVEPGIFVLFGMGLFLLFLRRKARRNTNAFLGQGVLA